MKFFNFFSRSSSVVDTPVSVPVKPIQAKHIQAKPEGMTDQFYANMLAARCCTADEFYARMTMERLLDHTAQPYSWVAKRDAYRNLLDTKDGDYVAFLAEYHDLPAVRAIYMKKLLNR